MSKIILESDLHKIRSSMFGLGRIVLCHGCFDLLHIGHIRYLQEARTHGDILVVSVTSDQFVNKGPGRPAFDIATRIEMIVAIECVSHIVVSDHPTAVEVINALKPDVFVKGEDYVAGGILKEELEAVGANGGRAVIATTPLQSSTTLINRHVRKPEITKFLKSFRENHSLKKVLGVIDSMSKLRVALIGETIIDEYIEVAGLGKAGKENILAVRATGVEERFLGGVVAAANHLDGIVGHIAMVTERPSGYQGDKFIQLVPWTMQKPITKTRFIDRDYRRKLFEVYQFDDSGFLASDNQNQFDGIISRIEPDLTIVTDFGHGLIQRSTIKALRGHACVAVNAQTNAGNRGYNTINRYSIPGLKLNYVCLDAEEVRLALRDRDNEIEVCIDDLVHLMNCENITATCGRAGSVSTGHKLGMFSVPAFTEDVVDTMGAGDAFFVISAAAHAVGADPMIAAFLGNVAGSIKVGVVGHRESITKEKLVHAVTSLMK